MADDQRPDVQPVTWLAVTAFEAVVRAEHRLERKQWALEDVVGNVPSEDIPAYVEMTEKIRARLEEQHAELAEAHERKREKALQAARRRAAT